MPLVRTVRTVCWTFRPSAARSIVRATHAIGRRVAAPCANYWPFLPAAARSTMLRKRRRAQPGGLSILADINRCLRTENHNSSTASEESVYIENYYEQHLNYSNVWLLLFNCTIWCRSILEWMTVVLLSGNCWRALVLERRLHCFRLK